MQWKSLLSTIGGINPSDTSLIYFKSDNSEQRLPPLVTLMLTIGFLSNNICPTVLDEGAVHALCLCLVGKISTLQLMFHSQLCLRHLMDMYLSHMGFLFLYL